jgi:hypothetical protein
MLGDGAAARGDETEHVAVVAVAAAVVAVAALPTPTPLPGAAPLFAVVGDVSAALMTSALLPVRELTTPNVAALDVVAAAVGVSTGEVVTAVAADGRMLSEASPWGWAPNRELSRKLPLPLSKLGTATSPPPPSASGEARSEARRSGGPSSIAATVASAAGTAGI